MGVITQLAACRVTGAPPKRLLQAATTLLVVLLLVACGTAAISAAAAASHHVIQTRQADGGFVEVGHLILHADGRAELTVTTTGAPAQRLREVWSDIDHRASLSTKVRAIDGTLVGRPVARGSPEFAAALADVMSREYGYFLSEMPTRK